MEGLAPEVVPFGIKTMLIEPGFFRTELLTPQSTQFAEPSIADYAERTKQTIEAWQGMDGKQGGDPAKLADALVELADLEGPPVRFAAGAEPWSPRSSRRAAPHWPCGPTSPTARRPREPCSTVSSGLAAWTSWSTTPA